MARLGMAIDTKRCVSCDTCIVACKVENNLPEGMWWNFMEHEGGDAEDKPSGTYLDGDLAMSCYTRACQQCSNPACVTVCPTGASYVEEATGIVLINQEECIGCGLCITACPYDVRQMLEGEPAWVTAFPMGGPGAPVHIANTVEKCTFCHHRLLRGEEPFCVEVCPGRARVFGDLDDPESEISQLIASRDCDQLTTEAGTEPNVYLLR